MTATELVAYIGAAAWLPQIANWIWLAASKPRLRLIPGPTVEVGYTTYGPILNLMMAVSSERRDALIEKMSVRIVHERGDTRTLTWKWLNEKQHEFRNTAGQLVEVSKNQPAIALRVGTFSLAEKSVGFHDLDFLARGAEILGDVTERYQLLQGASDQLDELFRSDEFRRAQRFFDDSMHWKPGTYFAEVNVKEVRSRKPHRETFRFVLSGNDVSRVRLNVGQLEMAVRASLRPDVGVPLPIWNWADPEISRTPGKPAER